MATEAGVGGNEFTEEEVVEQTQSFLRRCSGYPSIVTLDLALLLLKIQPIIVADQKAGIVGQFRGHRIAQRGFIAPLAQGFENLFEQITPILG